ncbi:MAG: hypothetical protein JW701_02970 [Kosmotogaceae bacterium]|nr:hypothetical protein [Kosmotogaceae bacterium]
MDDLIIELMTSPSYNEQGQGSKQFLHERPQLAVDEDRSINPFHDPYSERPAQKTESPLDIRWCLMQ